MHVLSMRTLNVSEATYLRKNIAEKQKHVVLYGWEVDSRKNYFKDRFGQKVLP